MKRIQIFYFTIRIFRDMGTVSITPPHSHSNSASKLQLQGISFCDTVGDGSLNDILGDGN